MVSEMERLEQFEELSLLQAWGAKLCLTIIGPSQVKSTLPTGMWATTLHHAMVIRELAARQAVVTSAMERVLRRSPDETSRVDVMNELTAKIQKLEELCSWLKGLGVRICDLLLGPLPGQAQWADHLE
jgi:hypothetical protein